MVKRGGGLKSAKEMSNIFWFAHNAKVTKNKENYMRHEINKWQLKPVLLFNFQFFSMTNVSHLRKNPRKNLHFSFKKCSSIFFCVITRATFFVQYIVVHLWNSGINSLLEKYTVCLGLSYFYRVFHPSWPFWNAKK